MRTSWKLLLALAACAAVPAAAEAAPIVFLASGGTATGNACATRTTPCGSINNAISAVDSEGEIICLDTGPFTAALSITTPVSFNCPGAIIHVDVLDINGFNEAQSVRFTGVIFRARGTLGMEISGGRVILDNCVVENASQQGILITAFRNPARVTLINTVVTKNALGNILARPFGSNPVWLTLDRVTMTNSVYGLRAEGQGAGKASVEAHASVAAHHSGNGFIAVSNPGQGPARLMITKSVAHNNAAYGAVATGAQAFMIVSDTALTENGTGLAQLNGSTVATPGNNIVNFNTTNAAGTITPISGR